MSPSSTQHSVDKEKIRKHVLPNKFMVVKTLYFFSSRRAVPLGERDAGWHHLREVTGAET